MLGVMRFMPRGFSPGGTSLVMAAEARVQALPAICSWFAWEGRGGEWRRGEGGWRRWGGGGCGGAARG